MKTNNLLITQGVILEDELDPTILEDELSLIPPLLVPVLTAPGVNAIWQVTYTRCDPGRGA